jgi:hypothetical protein
MKRSTFRLLGAAAFVFSGLLGQEAMAQVPWAQCTVEFANSNALNNIPQQARNTIAVSPWYLQTCAGVQMNFVPMGGNTHYHLGFEDPSIGTCFINNGFGRLVNGVCQQPNWAAENRTGVTTHNRVAESCFYPGGGRLFDVGNFLIRPNVPARVAYQDRNNGWWEWSSLPPGYWYLNAQDIKQMCVRAADNALSPTTYDRVDIGDLKFP